jgi:competence protein ComGF
MYNGGSIIELSVLIVFLLLIIIYLFFSKSQKSHNHKFTDKNDVDLWD